MVTVAGAGDAANGLCCADNCALPLSAGLSVELEFTDAASAGLPSLPHAPINTHSDAALSTNAKRLRRETEAGFDTTGMTMSPAWGRGARACMCRGQRCSSLIADLCKFCEGVLRNGKVLCRARRCQSDGIAVHHGCHCALTRQWHDLDLTCRDSETATAHRRPYTWAACRPSG